MPGRSMVSGAPAKEGFTGHELDTESGLIYAGARYYIPNIGRWTGVDPLAGKYPGWSPYNYVLNNPLGLVDPDGMAPCDPPRACDFRGWNSLRPFADALEYGYNQVANAARVVGDGVREGAAHLSRLSGLEGARAAPEDFQAGGAVVAEGIAELREGNVQEGLDAIATGLQKRSDAIGDVAGFIENISAPLLLTPAAPAAVYAYGTATFVSTTADATGVVLEIGRVATGSGSMQNVGRRAGFLLMNVTIPVRVSPRSETGQSATSIVINEIDRQTKP